MENTTNGSRGTSMDGDRLRLFDLGEPTMRDTLRLICSLCLLCAPACSASSGPTPEKVASIHQAVNDNGTHEVGIWDFGVRCEDSFQNGWQVTIDTHDMCNNFINSVNGGAGTYFVYGNQFYWDLEHAQADIQSPGDSSAGRGADSVDFFLVNTHGGNNSSSAFLAMWDQSIFAYTTNMRLGDNGVQANCFAAYACSTMYTQDNLFWTRWSAAFSGGVKIVLGAHALVYDDSEAIGYQFPDGMLDQSIPNAWEEAVYDVDNNNAPEAAATGANESDCGNRMAMEQTELDNEYSNFPNLRDSAIGWVCWSGYNGD
jgi:hypothetical protein